MRKRHQIEPPDFNEQDSDHCGCHPSTLPATDDDFCIPEGCPERIKTPKYPSPTSCLPEKQLHQLEEKIDAANRLLLDLGLSNEQPEIGRRMIFDGLMGQVVKMKIRCDGNVTQEWNGGNAPINGTAAGHPVSSFPIEQIDRKKRLPKNKRGRKKHLQSKRKRESMKKVKNIIEGKVQLVGRNFVQLINEGKMIIIPFSKICVIFTKKRFLPADKEQALIDIDPCFRRELTFNFGETVANDPEMIQLFFRLTLPMFLETIESEKVVVNTDNEQFHGRLKSTDSENLIIDSTNGEQYKIHLNSVCFIMKY